jgi:hypothetical protein
MATPNVIQRLKAQLLTSGLQQKDQPLFQIINQLIDNLNTTSQEVQAIIPSIPASGAPKTSTFLTSTDESAILPNSRNVLAGTGITFDDTVPNERTLNVTPAQYYDWDVLSNGDPTTPELIFAGGEVIMIRIP